MVSKRIELLYYGMNRVPMVFDLAQSRIQFPLAPWSTSTVYQDAREVWVEDFTVSHDKEDNGNATRLHNPY